MLGLPVPVTAGTLTGTTLAANVVNSSLTSVGTLTKLAIAQGTITTALSPLAITEARNNAGTTFPGITYTITDTNSAAGSVALQILGGSAGTSSLFSVGKTTVTIGDGTVIGTLVLSGASGRQMFIGGTTTSMSVNSGAIIGWSASATNPSTSDSVLSRLQAGTLQIGTTGANFAGSLKLTNLTHVGAEIDLSYSYNTPATGATITTLANENRTVINPAGTIAALTLTTPPTPVEGQLWGLSSTQIVTALTITGTAGVTVKSPPAALAVGSRFNMIYRAAITTWLPVS